MLGLIMLPFTIAAGLISSLISFMVGFVTTGIRVIINLTRILTRLLFRFAALPLSILSRNLFLFFIVALVIVVIVKFSSDDSAPPPPQTNAIDPSLTPVEAAPSQQSQPKNTKQPQAAVDPVMRREDGNSVFSTDLYKAMNDQQRAYYSHFYFDSMNKIPDGSTQNWSNGNTHGSMRIEQSFNNKLGHRCRTFTERLKVGTIEQTLSGLGCQNGPGTWCKLKVNATPACNLGGKPGFLENLGRWFKNLF